MLSIIYQINAQWSDTIAHKSWVQLLNQAEFVLCFFHCWVELTTGEEENRHVRIAGMEEGVKSPTQALTT